jgi:hypothetical protein
VTEACLDQFFLLAPPFISAAVLVALCLRCLFFLVVLDVVVAFAAVPVVACVAAGLGLRDTDCLCVTAKADVAARAKIIVLIIRNLFIFILHSTFLYLNRYSLNNLDKSNVYANAEMSLYCRKFLIWRYYARKNLLLRREWLWHFVSSDQTATTQVRLYSEEEMLTIRKLATGHCAQLFTIRLSL